MHLCPILDPRGQGKTSLRTWHSSGRTGKMQHVFIKVTVSQKNIVCRPQSQTISGFKKKRKMPTMILTEAGKNTKNFRYRSYNHIKYIYLLPRHLWEPMKPWHDLGILQSSHHVLSSTSNSALIRVSTGPWSLGLVTRTIVTSVSHFSIVSCPRL